jgi:DNA-directed RNA polymerase I subunit RPA2
MPAAASEDDHVMGAPGDADAAPAAALQDLVAPHISSFDFLLTEGLARVEEALPPLEVVHPATGVRLSVWLESLRVGKPMREETRFTEAMREMRVFPRECRQAGTSYTAPLLARVCWEVEGGDGQQYKEVRLSDIPVMVRSAACNLHATTQKQLVQRGEEANEMGGYFIVNGIERIIRLLINTRRHYIMGMVRGAYSRRGPTFTEFATAIRCVARDESSMTVRVHYMTTGSARLSFVLRRQEFFVPVCRRRCVLMRYVPRR